MRLGEGWRGRAKETHCLDSGLSESSRGGGVYKAGVGEGSILSGPLVPPGPQLRVPLGQQAHPHPLVPMKTLLSWFSVTLSFALRSDVFWKQILKEEVGVERKVGSGS